MKIHLGIESTVQGIHHKTVHYYQCGANFKDKGAIDHIEFFHLQTLMYMGTMTYVHVGVGVIIANSDHCSLHEHGVYMVK